MLFANFSTPDLAVAIFGLLVFGFLAPFVKEMRLPEGSREWLGVGAGVVAFAVLVWFA